MPPRAALAAHFDSFAELGISDRAALAGIEVDRRDLCAGEVLSTARPDRVYLLDDGWALARSARGSARHVRCVYLPRELIGLAGSDAEGDAGEIVVMQTAGRAVSLDRGALLAAAARSPRLSALILALLGRDRARLSERLEAMATGRAEDRLIRFLLDLRARLSVAGVGSGNRIRLPLTQAEIGEVIGATPVTVNKALKRFVGRGWLEIERPYYRILAREEMARRIGYVDRGASLDTSWFPGAA